MATLDTKAQSAIAILRQRGGYFRASQYGLIEIYGKDAGRFLQSQTTNDVKALDACCGQTTCLLDRKAHVLAMFSLYRRHESFRILAEIAQIEAITAHCEEYKFADKVEFLDLTKTGAFFAIQGADAPAVMASVSKFDPAKTHRVCEHDLTDASLWDIPVHIFRKSVTGECGYFIWVSRSHIDQFEKVAEDHCRAFGLAQLDGESIQEARIEAGVLNFGVDFNQDFLLPETGLEEIVASYSKGCFLGQEVLARVKSHGSPTRALVGIALPPALTKNYELNTPIILAGQEVGVMKSNCYSAALQRVVGFALLKRDWRAAGTKLVAQIGGEAVELTVSPTPFVQATTLTARAKSYYDQALALYQKEGDDVIESEAVALLRKAILIDPSFEDAFEMLGVILSKRGKLDEAIAIMEQLTKLNPDSVMAHTNLSVFYVEKGDKDRAEEEKAISMSIRMSIAARQASEAKQKEEESKQGREDNLKRQDMFKQVLAIDAEDLLANYGYGSCLVDAEQWREAVPYLEKAIAIKPMHTVAYVALARAYQGLHDMDNFAATVKKGIDVASKRGDLKPLNELNSLLSSSSSSVG